MHEIPGNFGIQYACRKDIDSNYPLAEPGMDAPNNIGIMLIGWLYGNNDFGKSICIAVGCGEDADCSAASLGALLGIINGNDYIPKEWAEPINGKITTVCINILDMLIIPKTVDELVQPAKSTCSAKTTLRGYVSLSIWKANYIRVSTNW